MKKNCKIFVEDLGILEDHVGYLRTLQCHLQGVGRMWIGLVELYVLVV